EPGRRAAAAAHARGGGRRDDRRSQQPCGAEPGQRARRMARWRRDRRRLGLPGRQLGGSRPVVGRAGDPGDLARPPPHRSARRTACEDGGMIVAISISPTSEDETGGVSEAVARAVQVIRDSGLPCETNAMFTNIEGEWDEVMAVVKQAVDVVAQTSPRVGLVLKADIRPGYDGQLTAKVE